MALLSMVIEIQFVYEAFCRENDLLLTQRGKKIVLSISLVSSCIDEANKPNLMIFLAILQRLVQILENLGMEKELATSFAHEDHVQFPV